MMSWKIEWKKVISAGLLLLCMAVFAVLLKAYLEGKFHSVDTLQSYVAGFGILAPIILTVIQAAQVVIPILPGFFGCIVGAVLFGAMGGFWCNYIGISAGSVIAFWLARRYGARLVENMFPGARYEKWSLWAGKSRFYSVILFLGMVLPLFPDDFFCYFSGLTKMTAKKFTGIIIVGKPWCILAYSLIFAGII
ncbi:MAG: VTT domain-containing protein [Eubacteriales bacterium]|nr:VTT domain-containing protein [Eubacteriales bacterium]